VSDAGNDAANLVGRVAVVTGAGSKGGGMGTGKATAVLLARAGASVVLVDRHEDRLADTATLIASEGGTTASVLADLATADDCDAVASAAIEALGGIDIVVHNAAAFAGLSFADTTQEAFDEMVAVNLTVPFMLSRAALPSMIERGGGSIVFISSVVALRGPSPPAYATAKAGLAGLTVSLAANHGRQGIRANCVVPGMVSTPMRAQSVRGAGLVDDPAASTATGVAGDAWDIAHAVAFLCSPAARHITGVELPVDGGATTLMR
jgi:NAD(P)-dependent dehydrogenase (short-subunit alcohol dehydrogenase family)